MLWFIVALFLNLSALVSARDVAGRDGGEGVGRNAGFARDATGTGSASGAATTPQVVFSIFTTATACSGATIDWGYAGPVVEMTIFVTDENVDQSPGGSTPAPSNSLTDGAGGNGGARRRSIPGHLDDYPLVIGTTDPNAGLFRWSPVNVPQGYYKFLASFSSGTSDVTPSARFFVTNGTDMSCLGAGSSTSTSSSDPTASASPTTFSFSSTASSPAEPTFPVNAVKKVNKGAIAGGVIGGLAIAAAVIAAFLFFRYSSASPRNTSGSKPGFLGKWGNLGSFDSAAGTKGKSSPAKARKAKAKLYNGTSVGLAGFAMGVADPQTRRHHSQAESMGGMISSFSSHGHLGRTPGGSAEDIGMYSPQEEKHRSPFSESGHEMMGTIPIGYEPTPSPSVAAATVSHGTKRSSGASSIFTYAQNNNFSRPRSQSNKVSPSPQTFPESPRNTSTATINSRRASSPAVNDNDFLESSRQPSPAFPSGSSGQAYIAGASYPTPAASPNPPLSSLSASSRKTPRKPVPTYDPMLSGYSDTPVDVSASAENVPHQLVHKDSHGSVRQMHYLIPDLPPPQRD
ncbi:hypothetical protein C8J56DRAFT_958211 [Mycena floridula]|nr:hypothetical protein C8J56DRAFT_958211 [Mycena floridula]